MNDITVKACKHFTIVQLEQSAKRKTVDYVIYSRSDGDILGYVNYHNHWRQHVFTPADETIWSVDCLEDVTSFLKDIKK